LDKQLASNENLVQRLAIAMLAVIIAVLLAILSINYFRASDPYVQEVLSIPGDVARGSAIFQMNCAGCHGVEANGKVGPSLHHVSERKSRVGLIKQVISGKTPPMPQFQPSPEDMADLLEYLESL
jgi:mono/diheme cytochrome c family protein